MNHNFTLLNVKRDLHFTSRNNLLGHKHAVSEFNDKESLDHEMDFNPADTYLDCSSDFSDEGQKQLMLDFIRLRSPSEGRRFRRNACMRSLSIDEQEDPFGPNELVLQQDRPFDVEYENCGEG